VKLKLRLVVAFLLSLSYSIKIGSEVLTALNFMMRKKEKVTGGNNNGVLLIKTT
jgi:hypothetical protein